MSVYKPQYNEVYSKKYPSMQSRMVKKAEKCYTLDAESNMDDSVKMLPSILYRKLFSFKFSENFCQS